MPTKLRLVTKRILIYINIFLLFLFLLSCLVPFLNPQRWWFISFLGLGFPFLLGSLILFMIGWLIAKKFRFALATFIALLIGYKNITVFFAFHSQAAFN